MQVVDSTTAVAKIFGLRSKSDFFQKSDFFNTAGRGLQPCP